MLAREGDKDEGPDGRAGERTKRHLGGRRAPEVLGKETCKQNIREWGKESFPEAMCDVGYAHVRVECGCVDGDVDGIIPPRQAVQ